MLAALLVPASLFAVTDTVYVTSDVFPGQGNLNWAINGAIDLGTLSTSVFKLEPYGYYVLSGTIIVPAGQHLTIVAPAPGTTQATAPPQILWTLDAEVDTRFMFDCFGDITLKNVWLLYANTSGYQVSSSLQMEDDPAANASGKGEIGEFDGVIFDYSNLPANTSGAVGITAHRFKGTFRNCYFRNCIDRHHRYYGRAVSFPFNSSGWHTDSVSFENCSFANMGYVYMQEGNEYSDYVSFNHCTFLNVMMFALESGWWNRLSVTNSVFVNSYMCGDILSIRPFSGNEPYGGTVYIQPISEFGFSVPFIDEDRHILFANSSYSVDQWLADYMDHGNVYSDTANAENKPHPQPMLSGRTVSFFNDDATFPHFSIANLFDATDPGFLLPPTNQEAIKAFLLYKWTTNADTNWAYDPMSDVAQVWPMNEDLSYTNVALSSAGMDGFPLGDLYHWWPTHYVSWNAQKETEHTRLSQWLNTGADPGQSDILAPTLAQPVNGATGVPIPPTFQWNAPTNAASYRLQVATDPQFISIVFDQANIQGTVIDVNFLLPNTSYYWHANAWGSPGTSGWSETRTFSTQNILPPTLSSGWVFKGVFFNGPGNGLGVQGVAVDPEGKVWISPYNPTETIWDGSTNRPTRALYVYYPNGSSAPFSPIKVLSFNGFNDTLYSSARGLATDNQGNILLSLGEFLYRIDFRSGHGLAKVHPQPYTTLTAPTADSLGNVYVGRVLPGNPVQMFDPSFTPLGNVVDATPGYSRTVAVSKSGKDVFWADYSNRMVRRYHSDLRAPGSYILSESILNNLAVESMTWNPKTGLLWVSTGSDVNPPLPPVRKQMWYGYDVVAHQVVDTIGWNMILGSESSRPRAIAFSPSGDTAYVGCFQNDVSAVQMFTRMGIRPPPSWAFRANTGKNATIGVNMAINPTIGTQPLKSGDAVGVFYDRNGASLCAGFGIWHQGQNLVITAWGDDPQTPEKDGFAEGEPLRFRVWDGQSGVDYNAHVSFQSGGPSYQTNGIYVLSELHGITTVDHRIVLRSGWNMISSFVDPVDTLVNVLFSGVRPNMVLMKNGFGQVYWPEFSINQIGRWNRSYGYQLYMLSPDTLSVTGYVVAPQSAPIGLTQGWNLAAYLRSSPLQADLALQSVLANLVLVKNNDGQVFWPSFGIDNIGAMMPGEGYQLYLSQAATLTYPSNGILFKGDATIASLPTPEHFRIPCERTGSSAVVLVGGSDLKETDEIGIWTVSQKLVGSGVVVHGNALVTIWGDNNLTTESVEGAVENEPLVLQVWSRIAGKTRKLETASVVDGLKGKEESVELKFQANSVFVIDTREEPTVPTEFSLAQNYPNPFNPATVIEFGLPQDSRVTLEVFNLLGQEVAVLLPGVDYSAGYHKVSFEARTLPSGIYVYRIRAGDIVQSRKMLLLR